MAGLGICLALALMTGTATAQTAEPMAVACAPTLMPLMARVAQAFAAREPAVELSLRETSTSQAVADLLAGEAALVGITRPLTTLEEAQARGKGLSLQARRVGTDCLLVVVHPSNPIHDLTLAELRGIFTGRLRKWDEVGGKDRPILVVVQPPETGAAQLWLGQALDRLSPRADASVQESHQDVLATVAANKMAIGYVSLGFLDTSVKALRLGGVNPGINNVAAGRYPICRPLLLVAGSQAPPAVKVAQDYLGSAEGQALVRESGFLPLK